MHYSGGKKVFGLICLMAVLVAGDAASTILQVDQAGTADYITIQEAVDVAVQGDSIQVAPGHYEEQLVFENMMDISVIGSGVEETWVDSPDSLVQSYNLNGYDQFPIVLISESTGILFSDLTLDGRGRGVVNMPFHGFGYFNSGGTIQNVDIVGLREEPLGYFSHGNGVFAVDLSELGHQLDMDNVHISDFQKTGVLLHGQGFKSESTNIHIQGGGSIIAPSQNGWQVSGMAELTADGCSASDLFYQSSVYVATGLLGTESTKLILTNCDFDECEASVYGIGNTTVYTGGNVTNAIFMGVVGKSFATKSAFDEGTPQPILLGDDSLKADGSMTMLISDVNVTGIDAGNSLGVALLSDNAVHVEMENVNISHFAMGLVTYEGYGEVSGTARNCTIFDNFPLGAFSNTAVEFDARFNNWNDPTGPFNRETNPMGLGNEAYGTIQYSPWDGGAALVITPASTAPVACGEPMLYTVTYVSGETTPDLFLYNIQIRGGEGLDRPVSPISLNPWGGTELFMHYDTGDSSITVVGSTIGGDPRPLVGPGSYDLFTFEVSAVSDSGGVVFLENVTLRTPENVTFSTSVFSSELVADCQAPAAVFDISANPHHNRIDVSWNHDGLDVDHYEVFTGRWHEGNHASVYPEYDDVPGNTIPTRPADYTEVIDNVLNEWGFLGNVTSMTAQQTWPDASKRGVYYYEVFAVDAVGNVSPAAAFNDKATNYWLGDVGDEDGFVSVYDLTVLGASFGESEGDALYNNYCDYGPTDTGGVFGIPTTDNIVGFEDLMILAMNFGVVSDVSKDGGHQAAWANLTWIEEEEGRYTLRLLGSDGIKGMRVRAHLPDGILNVLPGQLLEQQDETCFFRNLGSSLDVNLAIMGRGIGLEGDGDLFMVSSSAPIKFSDLDIVARDCNNQEIKFNMDEVVSAFLPSVFELKANHPNPFNPTTRISFSLPEKQDVRLKIYGVDGRCVATLIDESRSAGVHEVNWNGRNHAGLIVASGVYFYRIEAGPYNEVRKMSLMK